MARHDFPPQPGMEMGDDLVRGATLMNEQVLDVELPACAPSHPKSTAQAVVQGRPGAELA